MENKGKRNVLIQRLLLLQNLNIVFYLSKSKQQSIEKKCTVNNCFLVIYGVCGLHIHQLLN